MKTKAIRLYGKKDLRFEEFDLPKIEDDEILVKVVTDSICMSSYKLANLGAEHKKTPKNLEQNPIIIGHEFCGDILEVGKDYLDQFKVGQKYVVQANLQLSDAPWCPGYSYPYTGGDATYAIINQDVLKQNCLITYQGETYFEGSLVEPLSCVIGAFNANYHLIQGTYQHQMGIKPNGNLLIFGGTGPMGLIAIDYALHGEINPQKIVVTDIDQDKLNRAKKLYQSTDKTEIIFVNTKDSENVVADLTKVVTQKFDDVFVLTPTKSVIKDATQLLAVDGCLNFFAGPQDKDFFAEINFYDLHYNFTHYVGTSGGNVADVKQAVKLIETKKVNLAKVVTHVLGLSALAETTLNQPLIGGGKKLVYTHQDFNLMSLNDLTDSKLKEIISRNNGLWSQEAEEYILNNYQKI